MTTPEEILEKASKSPVWAIFTDSINEYVEECNAKGILITPEQREEILKIRLLVTLKNDPAIYKELAGYVWEELRKKAGLPC